MFVIFLGGHFAWFGVERAFLLFLWIYCIYRGDPVATATKADEYPPFIKWVFGVPEVHVFIFSAFVEWSILLIITINPLDKVLNHTCIYIDGGKFNLTSLKPKCIESKCKTYLFYPIYKVNTVLLKYTGTWVLSLRQGLQGDYHVQCISLPLASLLNSGTIHK